MSFDGDGKVVASSTPSKTAADDHPRSQHDDSSKEDPLFCLRYVHHLSEDHFPRSISIDLLSLYLRERSSSS